MRLSLPRLLTASVLGALGASASAAPPPGEISASSPPGRSLLSRSRLLNDGDDSDGHAWIGDYSLKFLGCHHVAQWNSDADGDGGDDGGEDRRDVRIRTRRLVRFRLCPTDSCGSGSLGCKRGYGDYVADLEAYAGAYLESKRRAEEQACETFLWKRCDCDEDDGQERGDDFDRDQCEYDCFSAAGKTECIDRNPYEDDEGEGRREEERVDRYVECAELELPDDDDGDNGRELEDEEGSRYYVGPYCASGGSKVLLGLFTDDTCTQFADDDNGLSTYRSLMGSSLPYGSASIVGTDCVSCRESEDVNDMKERQYYYEQYGYNEGNDAEDEDSVAEQCEELYERAGKCESNLGSGVTDYPVDNACDYINGIRLTVQSPEGVIMGVKGPSRAATAFIVIFALAFTALGAYVLYLHKRLGMNINLGS